MYSDLFHARANRDTVALMTFEDNGPRAALRDFEPFEKAWIKSSGFLDGKAKHLLVPDAGGQLGKVLMRPGGEPALWALASLPAILPPGRYRLADEPDNAQEATALAIGWALAHYQVAPIKEGAPASRRMEARTLVWPKKADRALVLAVAEGIALGRDLVNLPANILTPQALEQAARDLAKAHGAQVASLVGRQLLAKNYPAIYAVGAGVVSDASRAPRLIELRWGKAGPLITLVGKGVTFDTGGMDIKPAGAMATMKKDMGGSAYALGLASMIMQLGLPMRLRVLIASVENTVSDMAMRPQDVIQTRKGLSVEVGNTDAEGRLILADALADADDEKPDLLFDFATLTGAARVAMGAEVPAFFANDGELAARLQAKSQACGDLVWNMPLYAGYERYLSSSVADLNNMPSANLGGAITAALFLQRFVSPETPWLHMDTNAWNPDTRPGRPKGGELMGAYAVLSFLRNQLARGRRGGPA